MNINNIPRKDSIYTEDMEKFSQDQQKKLDEKRAKQKEVESFDVASKSLAETVSNLSKQSKDDYEAIFEDLEPEKESINEPVVSTENIQKSALTPKTTNEQSAALRGLKTQKIIKTEAEETLTKEKSSAQEYQEKINKTAQKVEELVELKREKERIEKAREEAENEKAERERKAEEDARQAAFEAATQAENEAKEQFNKEAEDSKKHFRETLISAVAELKKKNPVKSPKKNEGTKEKLEKTIKTDEDILNKKKEELKKTAKKLKEIAKEYMEKDSQSWYSLSRIKFIFSGRDEELAEEEKKEKSKLDDLVEEIFKLETKLSKKAQ